MLKYIDLFAGIGGFHSALNRLGHECVFASELSKELRELYQINHGIECQGDITKIDVNDIPSHDLLCAGFPCQSFSKAGNQNGMKEARGKLFDEILKILAFHKPKYIVLENVRNLLTHDNGKTWVYIKTELGKLNYFVDKKILSPHFINIPQHRERIFIIGSLEQSPIDNMKWVEKQEVSSSVEDILSHHLNKKNLEKEKIHVLDVWLQFIKSLPVGVSPYRPLWSMEFGATYPADMIWEDANLMEWQQYKGNYGYSLSKCQNIEEVFNHLPNYVKSQKGLAPDWKQRFIRNNRKFHKEYSESWDSKTIKAISAFKRESWKKFEWNCPEGNRCYLDKIIQFRGSGVRIKHNNYLPSLVTVKTQIPIVGKYKRYLLPEEGAKVQSLPNDIQLPPTKSGAFRVLGNMVNVELAYNVISSLIAKEKIVTSVE